MPARSSTVFALLSALVLGGCQTADGGEWWVQDFENYGKNYRELPTHSLALGENKSQVKNLIKAPHKVVRNLMLRGREVETWMYEKWSSQPGPDRLDERVYLFFVDGQLAGWNDNGDMSGILASASFLDDKDQTRPTEKGTTTGTGIVLNALGDVLTNHHVAGDCETLDVTIDGNRYSADVIASDAANDLAVLKTGANPQQIAVFRASKSLNLAEPVMVLGFPLRGLLADQVNATSGDITALAGINGDSRQLQISAPVQPGNSGGPVVDMSGNVVGIATSKLSASFVLKHTGTIPENINFAIKSSTAFGMLDSYNIQYQVDSTVTPLAKPEVAKKAIPFVASILCNAGDG